MGDLSQKLGKGGKKAAASETETEEAAPDEEAAPEEAAPAEEAEAKPAKKGGRKKVATDEPEAGSEGGEES